MDMILPMTMTMTTMTINIIKKQASDRELEKFPFRQQTGSLRASFQTSEGAHQHAFLCIKDRLEVRGTRYERGCGRFL